MPLSGLHISVSDEETDYVDNVISEPESHDGDGRVHFHSREDHEERDDGSDTGRPDQKSVFYDYQQDRTLKQADAKLFYQHQHSSVNSPMMRAQTFAGQISRTASVKSMGSHWNAQMRHGAPPVGLASWDKPARGDEYQGVGGLDSFDPHFGAESAAGRMGSSQIQTEEENYVQNDPAISAELSAIYTNVQKILDLRHKYLRLSLQGPTDNPKDDPSWNIYPAPPNPAWHPDSKGDSLSGSQVLNDPNRSNKKLGANVGADFEFEECEIPGADEYEFKLDERGVFQVYENKKALEHNTPVVNVPTIKDYYVDLDIISDIASDGPSKSFAFKRLKYLEGKFNLYILLNEDQEMADSKRVPHRDFYNVRKVDTHVHHSACMNQKHLLRFIKSKIKKCPQEVVLFRDGEYLTLQQVFDSIKLTAYDLSIDTLDMHAHTDSFHRFDKFNLKYNPVGESRLRTIFLKTDNYIRGRYLAEITREVLSDLEASKYQMAEYRVSIYGRSEHEWDNLAAWVVDNKLFSHNVRWLIQIPRLYNIYKREGTVQSFEEIIVRIFKPLFEVTKDPSSHPKLHVFLQRVVGFDSVDDESKTERRLYKKFPIPKEWQTAQNPPYSYWIYHLFANMTSLNVWRKQKGFNTFHLRPHCGEAGDTDHLATAVLCCHSISHGILLRKVPFLQYIFYLDQIGVAMSPLSNNALFLAYEKNPFLSYFKRGLNVSLSTDDPLQFAFTKEPLIEEYSVAAQIYKLTAVDMCELARNSVMQSGFEAAVKAHWLGQDWNLPGVPGNSMDKTNVPNTRVRFRHQTLQEELAMIQKYAAFTPENDSITPSSVVNQVNPAQLVSPLSLGQAARRQNSGVFGGHLSRTASSSFIKPMASGVSVDTGAMTPQGTESAHISPNGGGDNVVLNGSEPRYWAGLLTHGRMRRATEHEDDKRATDKVLKPKQDVDGDEDGSGTEPELLRHHRDMTMDD